LIDEDFRGPLIAAEEAAMKKVGTIDVQVYRHKETRIVKPKKCKLRKSVKEMPQKLMKGQAISLSIEYVSFLRFSMFRFGLEELYEQVLIRGHSLDQREKIDQETVYQATGLMDGEDHPIAIFRFKYRSRSMLPPSRETTRRD
jgi:hypothetical protein